MCNSGILMTAQGECKQVHVYVNDFFIGLLRGFHKYTVFIQVSFDDGGPLHRSKIQGRGAH